MNCSKCHKKIGVGYAQTLAGNKICDTCCAVLDKEEMLRDGKFTGYYVHERKPSVRLRFGAERTDFWFVFEGAEWHGVNIGDNPNARCKRKKG